jgi:lysozyme
MTKTIDIATKLIKLNEGCKLEVYTCPAGYKTFGYGTNLEVLDAEIFKTIEEINDLQHKKELAIGLLRREIVHCNRALSKHAWFTDDLSEFEQAIILDLAYNIGVAGVLKFQKMIKAIKQHNYGIAGEEMLDSKYHYQMVCYGYKDELADADINIANRVEVLLWHSFLDKDYKQLRSACNALSLQFNKPLGKYKGLF